MAPSDGCRSYLYRLSFRIDPNTRAEQSRTEQSTRQELPRFSAERGERDNGEDGFEVRGGGDGGLGAGPQERQLAQRRPQALRRALGRRRRQVLLPRRPRQRREPRLGREAHRPAPALLYIDVVHANAAEGTKPLIGSARLPLRDVLDDAGIGGRASRSLRLKRPSGRPQGRLDIRVAVREAARYYDPSPASYPPPYGQPAGSRDPYAAPAPYGSAGYGQSQYAAPPSGYPAAYGAAPPQSAGYPAAYGAAPLSQPAYGTAAPLPAYGAGGYGSGAAAVEDPTKKKKGMGMGAGLAVGAAAGVLGGLALAGGASYLEDKIEDGVAEKVEADMAAGGGYDDFGGDDDY